MDRQHLQQAIRMRLHSDVAVQQARPVGQDCQDGGRMSNPTRFRWEWLMPT
jgi:hypothetical protein